MTDTTITRLAPSPTGHIHLGNAWSFLVCWLAARCNNGKVIMRIDDIDPQRSREEHTIRILEDLRWLGLDWDEFYRQSERQDLYRQALDELEKKN